LKADPRTARTPIIVLATSATTAHPGGNGEHGNDADGCQLAPFDGELLRSRVERALRTGKGS
jgi:hypothetical protein